MSKPSPKKLLKQKLREKRVELESAEKRKKAEQKRKEEHDKFKAESADRREQARVNKNLITVDYKRNPLTPRLTREEAKQRFKDNLSYLEGALKEYEGKPTNTPDVDAPQPMFGGSTEFVVTPNPMPPTE
jgi:hypothetical protein